MREAETDAVTEIKLFQVFAKRMNVLLAFAAGDPPLTDAGEGLGRSLQGGALQVVHHPAYASHLFAASRPSWPSVDQARQRRPMARGLSRAIAVYDQHSPMERGRTQ